jgi:hypothetical protein
MRLERSVGQCRPRDLLESEEVVLCCRRAFPQRSSGNPTPLTSNPLPSLRTAYAVLKSLVAKLNTAKAEGYQSAIGKPNFDSQVGYFGIDDLIARSGMGGDKARIDPTFESDFAALLVWYLADFGTRLALIQRRQNRELIWSALRQAPHSRPIFYVRRSPLTSRCENLP